MYCKWKNRGKTVIDFSVSEDNKIMRTNCGFKQNRSVVRSPNGSSQRFKINTCCFSGSGSQFMELEKDWLARYPGSV